MDRFRAGGVVDIAWLSAQTDARGRALAGRTAAENTRGEVILRATEARLRLDKRSSNLTRFSTGSRANRNAAEREC